MSTLDQAYQDLYPDDSSKNLILKYSGRFRGYNANIRMTSNNITINASKEWRGISPDIQKGLFQELLVRLLKTKKQTIHMDLYHNFIKSLSHVVPKTQTHPVLEPSFKRVNDTLLNGMMVQPNLKIGKGINRLGTYEYATDTVTISQILLDHPQLMDYVMYHELLHKKHQYSSKKGHTRYHSKKFREDEAKFPNAALLEKELEKLVRSNKRRLRFWEHF